jgi:hypothetical protein
MRQQLQRPLRLKCLKPLRLKCLKPLRLKCPKLKSKSMVESAE